MRSSLLSSIGGLCSAGLFLVSIMVVQPLHGQDMTAFLDFRQRLIVFDRGTFIELDAQRPNAVGVGGNYIAYSNARADIMMYRNGEVTLLDRSDAVVPTVTDHLFGFKLAGLLKVHDGRQLQMLCANTGGFVVEDSLAGWFDEVQRTLNASWNGETFVLEDALAWDPLRSWKSGDNLLVWVNDVDRRVRVFYHGKIFHVADVFPEPLDYEAGADIVAYVDPRDKAFRAFYRGGIMDLDPIKPISYQVGKGIVAWQDMTGNLKVMEGGKISRIMDFAPQEYHVRDSLVVIRDQNILKVYQNGTLSELERLWPDEWAASWGTLAYRAADRTIRVWRAGRSTIALQEQNALKFTLERGLLRVNMPVNSVRVWWRGKTYTH